MKKHLPNIAGVLLGLCFLAASVPVLFHLIKMPPLPEGTPMAHFMAAFGPTGYLTFVKMFEFVGGLLVMIPRLRNFGLLLLGPVIINILACHIFLMNGQGLIDPMIIIILLTSLYLLGKARKKFAGLLN
ncbi:MAG TPA: hypothetical protein VF607_11825 [Verrucomicrobiae bacterium]